MQALIDQTVPEGAWVFDQDVANVFDNMLERSIPQYHVMRQAVFDMGRAYIKPSSTIVDLGCSRGEALAAYSDAYSESNTFYGCDVSDPMLDAARERLAPLGSRVTIERLDLRTTYPDVWASLTLCVLTLMFTPIEYRQRIVRNMYLHTLQGGAVILVEKLIGSTAELDELLKRNYYAMKTQNGYTREQIERKRLSLEGVQVPVTARWNEDLLHAAGFRQIECFWRWMNFAAWIAVREA